MLSSLENKSMDTLGPTPALGKINLNRVVLEYLPQ